MGKAFAFISIPLIGLSTRSVSSATTLSSSPSIPPSVHGSSATENQYDVECRLSAALVPADCHMRKHEDCLIQLYNAPSCSSSADALSKNITVFFSPIPLQVNNKYKCFWCIKHCEKEADLISSAKCII